MRTSFEKRGAQNQKVTAAPQPQQQPKQKTTAPAVPRKSVECVLHLDVSTSIWQRQVCSGAASGTA